MIPKPKKWFLSNSCYIQVLLHRCPNLDHIFWVGNHHTLLPCTWFPQCIPLPTYRLLTLSTCILVKLSVFQLSMRSWSKPQKVTHCLLSPSRCSIISRGLSPHRGRRQEPHSVPKRPQGATPLPPTAAAGTSAAAATSTTATATASPEWNDSSPAPAVGKLQQCFLKLVACRVFGLEYDLSGQII